MKRERIPNSAKYKPVPLSARLLRGPRLLGRALLWRVPTWLAVLVLVMVAAAPIGAQLQQSGGSGSNASVGSTGGTAPTSATLTGGSYNSTLPTLSSGQMGALQLDSSGRNIIVGAGTAGTAAGGVVSVQGVASGTAIPASENGTWNVGISAGTNLIGYTRVGNGCSTTTYESGMAYLPTTSTAVTSTSTCVALLALTNTSSSAQSITVTDGSTACNSAACPILSSFSLPGYSNVLLNLQGMKFTSGIKWSTATANTVMGDVIGNQ